MPFGLMNTPAVYQHLINDVIFIYSWSIEEHVSPVRWVLQLLLENLLYVKLEKLVFRSEPS